MTARKYVPPDEKLPLKLTATQRTLVLEGLMCLDRDIEQAVQKTPAGEPVMMTLDDLDVFSGFVAAEANHCQDKSKTKKLDTIFEKIQDLLDKFTDEEPAPDTMKIEEASKGGAKSTRKPKGKSTPATAALFQFRITLLGLEPAIWRRIQVQDCTLDKLHEHIQTAMGWTNSHLHQFDIRGERYGDPELLDDDFLEVVECIDSTKTMVSKVMPKSGKRLAFTYEYDFGDSWDHEVLFEGRVLVDPNAQYPLCLEGERACPPEDCGGIWGYRDFLSAIAGPKHPEHKDLLRWCGRRFAADEFDPAKTTEEMKKGLPDWRAMRDLDLGNGSSRR